MNLNRRTLLRGVAASAVGLLLPPSVGEAAAEVERRYWALGQMPGRGPMDADERDAIERAMRELFPPETLTFTLNGDWWFPVGSQVPIMDLETGKYELWTVQAVEHAKPESFRTLAGHGGAVGRSQRHI